MPNPFSDRRALAGALLIATLATAPVLPQTPEESPTADAALGVYVVLLDESEGPALLRYRGELPGLPAPRRREGSAKLDARAWESHAYLRHLGARQDTRLGELESLLGRDLEVLHRYRVLRNGFSLGLTAAEARRVEALPWVKRVSADVLLEATTDRAPIWTGADQVWDGSATGGLGANEGEGVVVGIIDTGVNADHPSFSASPSDGHTYTNPRGAGNYLGVCDLLEPSYDPAFPCNDKLIGAWDFIEPTFTTPPECEADGADDDEGHGSHVASIAVGNHLDWPAVSGVAPHANLITYDVCWYRWGLPWPSPVGHPVQACRPCPGCPWSGVCAGSAIQAAIDQAVLDGVDVLNVSILGSQAPWSLLDTDGALLEAVDAGVVAVASAGNSGPVAGTVTHLGPWVLTVGGTTHDRVGHVAQLADMSGGSGLPPADLTGASLNEVEYGPAPIVFASSYSLPNPPVSGCDSACLARRCLEPFPPATFPAGAIVACESLGHPGKFVGDALKGQNVAAGGAGGILIGAFHEGAASGLTYAHAHPIPSIKLNLADSTTLRIWLDGGSGHTGTITASAQVLDPAIADRTWIQSSRGPAPNLDLIKPDIGAPGLDLFATDDDFYTQGLTSPQFNWRSGTSMSSPHAAGAAALVKSLHPTWTPSEVKSALMTTAACNLFKENGTTPADPFDVGSGRLDLTQATRAGLVLDETYDRYLAANPALSGDPKTLNVASMADDACAGDCGWTRTVKSVASSTVTWTASFAGPDGAWLDVLPSSFEIAPGATQALDVSLSVFDPAWIGTWRFGELVLTPSDGDLPDAHLTIAVRATGTGSLIFPDGFESGDTSAWSAAVP